MEVESSPSEPTDVGGISTSLAASAAADTDPPASTGDFPFLEPPVEGVAWGSFPVDGPLGANGDTSAAERHDRFRQFVEFVKAYTERCIVATAWKFLELSSRLRIEMLPTEFVELMEEEYGTELLIELGLYERADEELRRPSWLDDDAPLYVTIDADNCSISFSSDHEFLFPMTRTALEYASERTAADSGQQPLTLFVVEDQAAVEVLRRLGLRAVCSDGLEALGRDDVERLFEGDERSDLAWRHHLLLLDFDVTNLKTGPLPTVGAIIARLADAEEVYAVNPARRFSVCRPTEPELRELQRAIIFEDSEHIRQWFEKWSAIAKCVQIMSWRSHFETAVMNFSAARMALIRALEQPQEIIRRSDVAVALPAYREAIRREIIQKFYAGISSATDPFERIDLIAAVANAEDYFDSDPLVREAEMVLAGQTPDSSRELRNELFERQQRRMVELRRIRDRKPRR